MGLLNKCVQVPKVPTTRKRAIELSNNFKKNVCWKTLSTEVEDQDFVESKIYLKSTKTPFVLSPLVDKRCNVFEPGLLKFFNHNLTLRVERNLSNYQELIFKRLRDLTSVIFANADKNVRPVAVLLTKYIEDRLIHLQNTTTHIILSQADAKSEDTELRKQMHKWTCKWRKPRNDENISDICHKLQESENDPFGYFYLLYKLHNNPVKTKPACSDYASTPHALGQWVNEML
jgi:hypothetical protein